MMLDSSLNPSTSTSTLPIEQESQISYHITRRILDAIKALRTYKDDFSSSEYDIYEQLMEYITSSASTHAMSSLSSLAPTLPTPITSIHISQLSELYQKYVYDADEGGHDGSVESLIQGAGVIQPVKRKRSPSFEAFLERMRVKQYQREYTDLVKDLPGNKSLRDRESNMASSFATVSKDVGVGVHVLVLMATGFIIFWYVGRQYFVGNQIWPVVCGLIGMILAMFLEIFLFLLRDTQMNSRIQRMKEQREYEQKMALNNTHVVQRKMEDYAKSIKQRNGKGKGKGNGKNQGKQKQKQPSIREDSDDSDTN